MNIPEPKFKIGDHVYSIQDVINRDSNHLPLGKFLIIEIVINICYGGIQIFYKVHGLTNGGQIMMSFAEIELTTEIPNE